MGLCLRLGSLRFFLLFSLLVSKLGRHVVRFG